MKILFRGGLEDNVNSETLLLDLNDVKPDQESLSESVRAKDLVLYVERNHIKEGYKHFASNGELEGGVLCIINEVDWDILEAENTLLKNTDTVHFITTLHGG
ncbi:ubiquitin related modifier 1 [Nematocida major]|uniref:ubiquitin related modifier 1 n=1 Tax=Nematocida major TaxID=1912982 RepID=UPI002007B818|nr:ubiquitin related modifier 1 [Nematocida major]KAH9386902.1 ubiquitin related modifier 1 [Nematocida major]